MAARKRVSEEEQQRREYARLAREERLGERYSSQSKTRRREVARERTKRAQNLGPAPVTDEKAATRNAERDQDRYRAERTRRYQAERGNRPGGPAQFDPIDVTAPGRPTRVRPPSTMTSGGPGGTADPVKALENDVYAEYVRAGYRMTPAVEDGLAKLEAARSLAGQSVRELGIAQGTEPITPAALNRDKALSFIVGPYLASRLPGGMPTKQDYDPLWDTLDIAGVIPFGRLGKGAGLISDAIGATKAIDSALGVRDGVRLIGPAGAEIATPAARSLAGRVLETAAEKARPVTSNLPGVMTPDQKYGKEVDRLLRTSAQVKGAAASKLGQLTKRLAADEKAAIRFLVEHGNGDAEELARRVAFHAQRATEAANPEARTLNAFVADAFKSAERLVEHTPDGWRLRPDAPAKLSRIMDVYKSAAGTSEDILGNSLEILDDAKLAERIQAPARLARGAKYEDVTAARVVERLREIGDDTTRLVGTRVRPADRMNIGEIVSVTGDRALVKFVNRIEGTEAEKVFPLSDLKIIDRIKVGGEVVRGGIRGAEDTTAGVMYAPYRRGNPVTANANPKTWTAAVRNFNAGRRSRVTFNVKNPALKKFTGALMDSGYFDINPGPALADNVMVAIRMEHAKKLRDIATKIGTPLPRSADDIAVLVDQDQIGSRVPEALRRVWDRMDNVAEQGKLDLASMDEIDPATLTRTLNELFPDQIAGRPLRDVAEELVFADTPIPGIVWINPGFADKAGILGKQTSRLAKRSLQTWRRYAQAGRKGEASQALLMGGVDAVNDLQKFAALYANPAYGPVQLVGNVAMNLMQQGVFMPANLTKAFRIANHLGDEAGGIVDNIMGEGFYQASTKWEAASPMRLLGKFYSVAIDLGPRRAAFFHEARRAGYKSSAELRSLLLAAKTDDKALATVNQIKQRALAAIVDFDRLSPFEKNVVTRLVWFYPWLKGATHYTKRFPLDHPYQAAALAYIENKRRETKPDGPWYTDYLAKLPVGQDLVMSVAQLHPMYTPMQIADSVVGWARGNQNAPQIVDQLTPFVGGAVRGLAGGTSPTTGAPVKAGLDTFKKEIVDPLLNPTVRGRIEKALRSDTERTQDNAEKLYKTSRGQDVAAIFGGTLVPRGYNEKVGAERKRALEGGKLSADEKAQNRIDKLADETGRKLPDWYVETEKKRESVNETAEMVRSRMEEDLGRDLEDGEKDQARVEALAIEAFGEDSPQVAKMVKIASSPYAARNLIRTLEARLGFTRASGYKRVISR